MLAIVLAKQAFLPQTYAEAEVGMLNRSNR